MSYVLQADGTLLGTDEVGDTMTFARATAAQTTPQTAAQTDSVAGAWNLIAIGASDGTVNDAAAYGSYLYMQLNADGTGRVVNNVRGESCTWTQSGASVTIVEESGAVTSFTLQPEGTLTSTIEGMTLILSRAEGTAAESAPASSQSAWIESEYGFRLQLPQNWAAVDGEFVDQFTQSLGAEVASANGFNQNLLDQLAASDTSLYYASDLSANFNVVREPANEVTMDNFALLEPAYQELFRNTLGITDFKLSGPVDINTKPYYVGTYTYQGGMNQIQYFRAQDGYIYTITLTNVADGDAELILGSFEIL